MSIDPSKLRELYSLHSKHSNYQILPKKIAEIIGDEIDVRTRYEAERLTYVLNNIDVKNRTILDIGGNTGFFTFELVDRGAKKIHYYEGNRAHAEFVKLSTEYLHIEDKVEVTNEYYSFMTEKHDIGYDVVLLLNVLHHYGDDYGDKIVTKEKAKATIIEHLNNLAKSSKLLVFQLGFNWKGNREVCLFDNGTKKEMIDYIREGTKSHWRICKIGIAECRRNKVEYYDLTEMNMKRQDHLGEFLNRPIFIMESIKEH